MYNLLAGDASQSDFRLSQPQAIFGSDRIFLCVSQEKKFLLIKFEIQLTEAR